ncbi:MAG: endo-1,4-beta-xylanase, partial [Saprospiraceae bacterium]
PNPFREMTTIGFHLPEATNATLTIFDVTGKTLKTIAADYDKGYHQIDISKSDLSQIGVLYYRLETSSQTATKKMLFIH